MALTVEQIEAHILAIQNALAAGVQSASQPDIGSVTYRSTSDMIAALNYYQGLLGTSSPAGQAQSFASFSKD